MNIGHGIVPSDIISSKNFLDCLSQLSALRGGIAATYAAENEYLKGDSVVDIANFCGLLLVLIFLVKIIACKFDDYQALRVPHEYSIVLKYGLTCLCGFRNALD